MSAIKIKTYLFNVSVFNNDEEFYRAYNMLSEFRKEKVLKYKFRASRNLSLGAGAVLSKALKNMGIDEKKVQYGENRYGKPYIKNYDNVFFSLSHSGETVICTVYNKEVGADIERLDKVELKLARRFFTNKEYEHIVKQEEKSKERFFKIWTLKESFIKAIGKGLSQGLDSFEVPYDDGKKEMLFNGKKYFFKEYNVLEDYKIACCCEDNSFDEDITVLVDI